MIHAEAFLGPLRAKYADVEYMVQCGTCGAGWLGRETDGCRWCEARNERMQEHERQRLLYPAWATHNNGTKYDDLDEVGKSVWRQTRGQRTDADSVATWMVELAEAVREGGISIDDAERAINRVVPP